MSLFPTPILFQILSVVLYLWVGFLIGCTSTSGPQNASRQLKDVRASTKDATESIPELLREIFHLDGTQAHLDRVQLIDSIVANALIKLSAGLNEDAKPDDNMRQALQAALAEKIRNAYARRPLSEELIERWTPHAEPQRLETMRKHLRADLYQRYLARLTEIKSATGQRKLGIFLARIAKNGLEAERVSFARRWLRATQERELLYLLSYELSEEIFATAKPMLADWAGESYESFQSDIDAREDAFRARVEKSLFYETLFAFDSFSLQDQETLITFWESRDGFSYVQKKMSTLRDVLAQAHQRFQSEVSSDK